MKEKESKYVDNKKEGLSRTMFENGEIRQKAFLRIMRDMDCMRSGILHIRKREKIIIFRV
jgi:hypothetical protein